MHLAITALPHMFLMFRALPPQLASFQGGVDSKTSPAAEATPLPPEQMRPPGPLTLAGEARRTAWVRLPGLPCCASRRYPVTQQCKAVVWVMSRARQIAPPLTHSTCVDLSAPPCCRRAAQLSVVG